jgi:hypothetical protein
MEAENSLKLINISQIINGVIVLKSGGLRRIVMVSGINFALKSEQEQNIILGGYQGFLNSLDFPIQILIHSRKVNIENYIRQLDSKIEKETNPLLQTQLREYQSFVSEFVKVNDIMIKNFFVIVPYETISSSLSQTVEPLNSLTSLLPFGKKSPASNKKPKDAASEENQIDEEFKKNVFQLDQRANKIVDGLQSIGLNCAVLDTQEITELLYNFYNPETVEQKKEDIIEK